MGSPTGPGVFLQKVLAALHTMEADRKRSSTSNRSQPLAGIASGDWLREHLGISAVLPEQGEAEGTQAFPITPQS